MGSKIRNSAEILLSSEDDGDDNECRGVRVGTKCPPDVQVNSEPSCGTAGVSNRNAGQATSSPSGTGKGPALEPGPATGEPGSMPSNASAPITSHFDAVLECLDVLRSMRDDDSVSKQDVVECIRPMLHSMLSSGLMHSYCTSMSVRGWKVE